MMNEEWIKFREACELRHISHGYMPDACGIKEPNGVGEWVVYHGDCVEENCERFKEAQQCQDS